MLAVEWDYCTKASCCAALWLRSVLYDNTCFSAVVDSSMAQTSKECTEENCSLFAAREKWGLFQWPVPSICLNTWLNCSRVFRHPVRTDKQLQLGVEPAAERPPRGGLSATSLPWVRAPLPSQPARRDKAPHLGYLST